MIYFCNYPNFFYFVGVFALLNAYCALNYVRSYMTKSEFKSLFFFAVAVCAGIVFCAVVFLTYAGKSPPYIFNFGYISGIMALK